MLKKLPILLCFLFFNVSFSQVIPNSDTLTISILTVGTADESHSLYGHTAIRIKDLSRQTDMVYNYGMFDFATENFILKFVKGDLQYFAASYPFDDFEYSYRYENRSIYEQVLDLSAAEKLHLRNKLEATLYSKDRLYTYKFIDRNCTTKVIDIVNEVLESKPIIKKNIDSSTYREVLYPYAENHFFQKLGINIIFGDKVDHKADKIFLPFDLYDNLKNISYKNKPIVLETKTIFEANRKPAHSVFDSIYILIGVLVLLVVFNTKAVNISYFFILGLLGIFFSGVGFYSFHKELLWNYNILLFNPLLLVLVFFIIRNNTLWIKRISWACLFALGLYTIYMFNKIHLGIVLPIVLTTALLLIRLIIKKVN